MLNDLFQRRAVFLFGKGGAGTTTVSGALALAAADAGLRVLALECDPRGPMAAMLGAGPSFRPVEISEHLYVMVLEGGHALQEYLGLVIPARAVMRAVTASRLYQFFVQAAPGLKELMMLGKVYYEAGRKAGGRNYWDLIVVDGPASGKAFSVLGMPAAARETFGDSVVGRESRNIARMLQDPLEFAAILVTVADPLSVSETLETAAAIRELGIAPGAIVLNRSVSASFPVRAVSKLEEHLIADGSSDDAGYLARLARIEIARASRVEHAMHQLRSRIKAPVVSLPEEHGASGARLVRLLAQEIASWMREGPPRQATGQA